MEFLQKIKQKLGATNSPDWIGWYLNTPLEISITWNQNRARQVPESIIQAMYNILQNFPPIIAEGFTLINTIDITSPKFSVLEIEKLIKKLLRSIINSQNRKANITLHQYSNFLDFEKLLHLISLIVKYPGIGNLQNNYPDLLEKILGYKAEFNSDIQEITAIIAKERGNIYACENAINNDLKYLAEVGILPELQKSSISLSLPGRRERGELNLHSYSEATVFNRLIGTIRFYKYEKGVELKLHKDRNIFEDRVIIINISNDDLFGGNVEFIYDGSKEILSNGEIVEINNKKYHGVNKVIDERWSISIRKIRF